MLHFLAFRFTLLKPVANGFLWFFSSVFSKFLWLILIGWLMPVFPVVWALTVRWLVCTCVARVQPMATGLGKFRSDKVEIILPGAGG